MSHWSQPYNESPSTVDYATPTPRPGAQVWAAAVIMLGGLGLVLLGGCFLIGVMVLVYDGPMYTTPELTLPQWILSLVLYACSFACFGGAIWLIVLSLRGLLKLPH